MLMFLFSDFVGVFQLQLCLFLLPPRVQTCNLLFLQHSWFWNSRKTTNPLSILTCATNKAEKTKRYRKLTSFSFENFWLLSVLLWCHWYPWLGLLEASALGPKARVDSLLGCFLAWVQWILQIHLQCNTSWPLNGQHGFCFDTWYLYTYQHWRVNLNFWMNRQIEL